MFYPKGTPRPIVDKLNAEINQFLSLPATRAQLVGLGAEIAGGPPEEPVGGADRAVHPAAHGVVDPADATGYVIGAEFFPIPYLELRLEYRRFDNDDYTQAQYTLQMHAFF